MAGASGGVARCCVNDYPHSQDQRGKNWNTVAALSTAGVLEVDVWLIGYGVEEQAFERHSRL